MRQKIPTYLPIGRQNLYNKINLYYVIYWYKKWQELVLILVICIIQKSGKKPLSQENIFVLEKNRIYILQVQN